MPGGRGALCRKKVFGKSTAQVLFCAYYLTVEQALQRSQPHVVLDLPQPDSAIDELLNGREEQAFPHNDQLSM